MSALEKRKFVRVFWEHRLFEPQQDQFLCAPPLRHEPTHPTKNLTSRKLLPSQNCPTCASHRCAILIQPRVPPPPRPQMCHIGDRSADAENREPEPLCMAMQFLLPRCLKRTFHKHVTITICLRRHPVIHATFITVEFRLLKCGQQNTGLTSDQALMSFFSNVIIAA